MYPLVGAVLGVLLWGFGYGISLVFPLTIATILTLVWVVSLTGALHLDGLMDTADGILSHRPREQMLEIMKDSRVGAMGVIVCVLALLLKGTLFYTLLQSNWNGIIALPFIWSRWFMVAAIYYWPYARKDSGLGSYFKGVNGRHFGLATWMACIVSLLVIGIGSWIATGQVTLMDMLPLMWIMSGTILFGSLIATYMHRKLGGLTGDTYGALNELLEIVLLLICVLMV